MRLLDLERHFVLTWIVAILGGVGALGLCAVLALGLGLMQTGWFNVVVLIFGSVLAVAPAILQFVRRRSRKRTATNIVV